MHRHKWGRWWQETREVVYEHESHNRTEHVTYNLCRCEGCGMVKEREASRAL